MDEADEAQKIIEREINLRIEEAQRNQILVKRTGRCLNCDEQFLPGDHRLYCDSDCADDYEKRTRMRNR